MASTYPGSLDSFDTIASDKKTSDAVGGRTHRDMHNDLGDAIEAVQTELGTDPAGVYATVKARFEAIEGSTLPQIDAKGDLVVGTADNTYDNLTVGANNTVLVADSAQAAGVKWASTVGVWTVAGLRVAYAAKTSAYTATVSDDVIEVTSGTFTVDLPAASTAAGKTLKIRNSGTGVVTLDGNSSETVAGVATFPLGRGSYVEITSTGAAWILTGGTPDTSGRNLAAESMSNGWTVAGALFRVRRSGSMVYFSATWDATSATSDSIYTMPSGFRPAMSVAYYQQVSSGSAAGGSRLMEISGSTGEIKIYSRGSGAHFANGAYMTEDAWPTSLLGTAT